MWFGRRWIDACETRMISYLLYHFYMNPSTSHTDAYVIRASDAWRLPSLQSNIILISGVFALFLICLPFPRVCTHQVFRLAIVRWCILSTNRMNSMSLLKVNRRRVCLSSTRYWVCCSFWEGDAETVLPLTSKMITMLLHAPVESSSMQGVSKVTWILLCRTWHESTCQLLSSSLMY